MSYGFGGGSNPMGFLSDLVSSPGLIFGPLMLLAGAVAAGMCGWATLRPGPRAARRAAGWSVAPAALGVTGAAFGAIRWAVFYGPAVVPWSEVWPVLGYTALFGVLVSLVPLAWAVALARRAPRRPVGQAAADYDDQVVADHGV
jgi:hypothetical protein